MTRCTVVGAGAWGTALADLLARNGHPVRVWAYEWDVVESINRSHQNRRFLPGCALYDTIEAFNDIDDALEGAELVTFATPSQVLRSIARTAKNSIADDVPVVVASKGIEHETLALMTDVAAEEVPQATIVALSGPSFASEV